MKSAPLELDVETRHEKPYLIQPAEASRALILYLHWFDEAPNANRAQFVDEADEMTRHGITSVLPQLTFPWKVAPGSLERDRELIEAELAELEGIVRRGKEVSQVDRLVIVGHDFGAMHGALLARSVQPEAAVLIAATPRWADWLLPFWPIEGDRFDYMRGLDPYDPIEVVKDFTFPTFFQFGETDFYIAPMSGMGLAKASPEPRRMETYDAGHAMDSKTCRDDRIRFILETLGAQGSERS